MFEMVSIWFYIIFSYLHYSSGYTPIIFFRKQFALSYWVIEQNVIITASLHLISGISCSIL